jgi:ribonuclease D
LSGLHTLRGRRTLAIARELWEAREELAIAQDVSPGRLVPDRSLVAAIAADPESKRALSGIKEFNGRASRTELDRWWAAFERGRATDVLPPDRVPSDTLPPPRAWADRNPGADLRLKAARPVVEERATALNMPTENLLTPELLRRVAWEPPAEITPDSVGTALRELGARAWQVHETAQLIADAFVASVQDVASPAEAGS